MALVLALILLVLVLVVGEGGLELLELLGELLEERHGVCLRLGNGVPSGRLGGLVGGWLLVLDAGVPEMDRFGAGLVSSVDSDPLGEKCDRKRGSRARGVVGETGPEEEIRRQGDIREGKEMEETECASEVVTNLSEFKRTPRQPNGRKEQQEAAGDSMPQPTRHLPSCLPA